MRNWSKGVVVVAAAGLVAVGGSAYTAANTVPNQVAGYGTSTISGGTVGSIVNTFNATGDKITATALTFTAPADISEGFTVKAGFGTDALTACVIAAQVATCTWAGDGQSVSGASALNVLVSQNSNE